jgi:hypothetical protein
VVHPAPNNSPPQHCRWKKQNTLSWLIPFSHSSPWYFLEYVLSIIN